MSDFPPPEEMPSGATLGCLVGLSAFIVIAGIAVVILYFVASFS